MGYTIFGTEGVAPTLTSTTSRHYERYRIGNRFRRLTNIKVHVTIGSGAPERLVEAYVIETSADFSVCTTAACGTR